VTTPFTVTTTCDPAHPTTVTVFVPNQQPTNHVGFCKNGTMTFTLTPLAPTTVSIKASDGGHTIDGAVTGVIVT
jgi:hypothetical protein